MVRLLIKYRSLELEDHKANNKISFSVTQFPKIKYFLTYAIMLFIMCGQ